MKTQTQGFLEVTIFDDESADVRDGSGVVDIGESQRSFVALALLGGLTDELVARAAIGTAKARMENPDMTCNWGDDRRFEARCVINAIFGISEH